MAKKNPRVTHRLPDDQSVLAAIGVIALRHGQLDNQLRMLIMDFTGATKEETLDATVRDSSRELRDRIRKLARKRLGEGDALVKLQALLERTNRATVRRNQLLHGVWGLDLNGGGLMIRDETHTFKRAPSTTQLEQLGETIVELLADIVDARMDGFLREALNNNKLI